MDSVSHRHASHVWFLPVVCLCLLLLFPALSVEGACSGLLLWFNVVLPTLAPFIICTQMVVSAGAVDFLMKPVYPLFRVLFGLSLPGSYVMLCGFLCGYPLGAKMCADFRARRIISSGEAAFLLSICNHPSPMFVLGYVRGQLPVRVSPFLLLACLYLPVLPVSLLSRRRYHFDARSGYPGSSPDLSRTSSSLEDTIASTCETMVIIGGYIMLFSILSVWIRHLTIVPPAARALLTGAAEITTGVNALCAALPPEKTPLPVLAAVAFGGFSGIFQTKSVIRPANCDRKNAGLSIRHYIVWKAVHACLSCVVFILLSALLPR